MGNINSIPVVSQFKSLVQVISGDEAGAREIQEEFARKGIIVSQVNSMAHAIMGNEAEARKIQFEFAGDMENFADNMPVVGHIKSGVHMAMGDEEKAKEVALSATKSTVVGLSAIAGAACGPGAAACGAALAVSSNAFWDGVDSAIANENRGIVKAVNDIANGDANVEEVFDTVAGQGMLAAGGAMAAKAGVGSTGAKAAKAGLIICKRSIAGGNDDLFMGNLYPSLGENTQKLLPKHLKDFNLNSDVLSQPENLAVTLYTVFLVLKLISIGHPASKPYYDEICSKLYPDERLDQCESHLHSAIDKFGNYRDVERSLATNMLEDSLESLLFQMQHLTRNTTIGFNLKVAICFNFWQEDESQKCVAMLSRVFQKLKSIFDVLDNIRIRRKRATGCTPEILVVGMTKSPKATTNFISNHILPDDVFAKVSQNLDDLKINNADFVNEKINFRQDVAKNTFIKAADLDNLNLVEAIDTGKSFRGNQIYKTSEPINMIVVDHLKPGAGSEVSIGRGTFTFTKGLDGEINHFHGTQFLDPPIIQNLPSPP